MQQWNTATSLSHTGTQTHTEKPAIFVTKHERSENSRSCTYWPWEQLSGTQQPFLWCFNYSLFPRDAFYTKKHIQRNLSEEIKKKGYAHIQKKERKKNPKSSQENERLGGGGSKRGRVGRASRRRGETVCFYSLNETRGDLNLADLGWEIDMPHH